MLGQELGRGEVVQGAQSCRDKNNGDTYKVRGSLAVVTLATLCVAIACSGGGLQVRGNSARGHDVRWVNWRREGKAGESVQERSPRAETCTSGQARWARAGSCANVGQASRCKGCGWRARELGWRGGSTRLSGESGPSMQPLCRRHRLGVSASRDAALVAVLKLETCSSPIHTPRRHPSPVIVRHHLLKMSARGVPSGDCGRVCHSSRPCATTGQWCRSRSTSPASQRCTLVVGRQRWWS